MARQRQVDKTMGGQQAERLRFNREENIKMRIKTRMDKLLPKTFKQNENSIYSMF